MVEFYLGPDRPSCRAVADKFNTTVSWAKRILKQEGVLAPGTLADVEPRADRSVWVDAARRKKLLDLVERFGRIEKRRVSLAEVAGKVVDFGCMMMNRRADQLEERGDVDDKADHS